MKNKKLLAAVLLPLSLVQTVSAWFADNETKDVILELLAAEKVPDMRRIGQKEHKLFV